MVTISVIIGILVGLIFVIGIKIFRGKRETVNSLVNSNNLVGIFGEVQIPFDQKTKGKIRVNIQGSMIDVVACTHSNESFFVGDQVFVIEAHNNQVWVIPKDNLKQDLSA
jgi:hypothetical protein